MKATNKRWISLIAGLLIEFCIGLPYSWSVFQNLLAEKYGWSIPATAWAYSLASIIILIFTIFFTAPLVKRLRIKRFLMLGCLFYGGGTLACGFIQGALWELYLYYGVAAGVGTAILYPTLTSYSVRIFPDKQGLASGLMVAGYGCGPFVLAPIIARVYEKTGDVSKAFILLGISFLVIIFILCFFIKEPENLPIPEHTEEKKTRTNVPALNRGGMFKTSLFYIIYLTFAVGIINSTMILTQASPILRSGFALSTTLSASLVGAFSLSNTVGRLLCGFISDRLGRPRTVMVLQIFTIIGFTLLLTCANLPAYIFALALCIFCLGGFAASLAPATAEAFGTATLSENYPVMFSIFTIAGIVGLQIITNAGYKGAYIYGLITAVIGVALSLVYQKMRQRIL
jgi:OFA family oxalate/formate antiporter-like MFS transporter